MFLLLRFKNMTKRDILAIDALMYWNDPMVSLLTWQAMPRVSGELSLRGDSRGVLSATPSWC